ncbi:MAG: hypothetical protein P8X64_09665 [Anaerolineales bacterium]|jgi:hypothetical protein
MRRRRGIRRIFRRAAHPLRPLGVRARRMLLQAHTLLQAGKHADAAALFDQLAQGAQQRNLPQYPQLLVQAGRAHILAGDQEDGIVRLTDAFQSLIDLARVERLRKLAPSVQRFLQSQGMEPAWAQLETMLMEAGISIDGPEFEVTVPDRLPAKCPYCSGTLNPSEVERTSGGDALCLYCGSVVQGTG